MTNALQVVSELLADLSPEERALLSSALASRPEPIAVVGIGCRLPGGGDDPASLWRLLSGGVDAVREIPRDRWDVDAHYDPDPDAPGRMYTRYGAFLERVDGFDPHFFEISPREAARMDPQQRLLLEVVWEALEDAGQAPDALRRTRTGVFVGGSWHDYEQLQAREGSLAQIDPHTLTGDLSSVLAGRVSYTLGLEGPSLAVDTACSSSLVAIHLACDSLRAGQSDLAIAGGVNLILSPDGFIKLSKMRALSPDGRCRTFDARANGFARGEGAGALVLRRLADARRAGDRVWAVVRGSAVNHDGRSAGLAAPNGLAQREVIRAALEAAGVAPAEVGYIEAHGTGTPLGDPIEMEALRDLFGEPRPDGAPCLVSSIKTNLGHLEAAAGVAGAIKAILCLWHGAVPAHLHWTQQNPRISLAGTPLAIPTEPRPWPRRAGPRVAGVSSFGISGTNAHLVLAEAPPLDAPAARGLAGQAGGAPETGGGAARSHHLLTLSAKTPGALAELAGRFAGALSVEPPLALEDVARSANTGRAHHACRLALVAAGPAEAAAQLEAFAAGRAPERLVRGEAAARPKVAFLFAGQAGPPRAGLERRLVDSEPVLRRTLERCDALFRPLLDGSVLSALVAPAAPAPPPLARASAFALGVALAALLRSWGVEPDLVAGDDVGEVAAACAAGALSLEDAAQIAAGRAPRLEPRPSARAGIVSGATGQRLHPDEVRRPETWSRPPGDPAGFAAAARALRADGCSVFVEIGPGADLIGIGRSCLPDDPVAWIPSLSGGHGPALLEALASLHVRGVPVDWAAFHEGRPGRRISLPTYPFQRESLWLPSRPRHAAARELPERLADLLQEITWQPAPALPPPRERRPARWLLLADRSGFGDELAARLKEAGQAPILARLERSGAADPGHPHGAAGDALDAALRDSERADAPLAGVVDLRALDLGADGDPEGALTRGAGPGVLAGALSLLGALVERKGRARGLPRAWLVTRGAQPASSDGRGDPTGFAQAPLWGLGRVFGQEHPDLRGGLVDIDPSPASGSAAQLAGLLTADGLEPEIALRGGVPLVPRVARCAPLAGPREPPALRAGRTYLLTGGLGALGLRWARWMVERGARHLVLLGRRPPGPEALAALAALRALGAGTHVLQADVASAAELAGVVRRIDEALPPLAGVVHAAGVKEDAVLSNVALDSLERVLAPKVQGTLALWEATRRYPLDFFVLFSSVAALLGNPGQASYAAANAFQDAFAHHLRARGAPALSIAWGPLDGGGMAEGALGALKRRWGLDPLLPDDALALFERALSSAMAPRPDKAGSAPYPGPSAHLLAARFDLARLAGPAAEPPAGPAAEPPAEPAAEPPASAAPAPAAAAPAATALAAPALAATAEPARDAGFDLPPGGSASEGNELSRRLAACSPEARLALLIERVGAVTRSILDLNRSFSLHPDQRLDELGMDSLLAIELAQALGDALGLTLPPTLAMDQPTVSAMARYLAREIAAMA